MRKSPLEAAGRLGAALSSAPPRLLPERPNVECNRTADEMPTEGQGITRPNSPRFSSRSPSRISRPTFRLAMVLVIDFILNLSENACRNVLGHVLRVQRQHPDRTMLGP